MAPPGIATIGVYGFAGPTFAEALGAGNVGLVVDVRQRRGVRGREHSWANAKRLQNLLRAEGIVYRHERALAPTTELRQLQYREDAARGVGKRSRDRLAPEYVRRYEAEILDAVDLAAFAGSLPADRTAALMCVEREAPACHRSLVAHRLEALFGVEVTHLSPP